MASWLTLNLVYGSFRLAVNAARDTQRVPEAKRLTKIRYRHGPFAMDNATFISEFNHARDTTGSRHLVIDQDGIEAGTELGKDRTVFDCRCPTVEIRARAYNWLPQRLQQFEGRASPWDANRHGVAASRDAAGYQVSGRQDQRERPWPESVDQSPGNARDFAYQDVQVRSRGQQNGDGAIRGTSLDSKYPVDRQRLKNTRSQTVHGIGWNRHDTAIT